MRRRAGPVVRTADIARSDAGHRRLGTPRVGRKNTRIPGARDESHLRRDETALRRAVRRMTGRAARATFIARAGRLGGRYGRLVAGPGRFTAASGGGAPAEHHHERGGSGSLGRSKRVRIMFIAAHHLQLFG
jgi:hypothetical protein